MVNRISVEELRHRLHDSDNCQLIDVREAAEFQSEKLSEAHCLPLSAYERWSGEIDEQRDIYLLCHSGNRAAQAAQKLIERGVTRLWLVDGGMAAWKAAGLPIVKGQSRIWSLERQVRFVVGVLTLTGIILSQTVSPYFLILSALLGAGLIFAAVTDTCGMALILAKMPWNQISTTASKETSRAQSS